MINNRHIHGDSDLQTKDIYDIIRVGITNKLPPKPERNVTYMLPKDCPSIEID